MRFVADGSFQRNDRSGDVYGCVTCGDLWQFIRLSGSEVVLDDSRHVLFPLGKLLSAFHYCMNSLELTA